MTDRNTIFARTLIAALAASGVEHACVTPGSRNAPLSLALADSPINDWSHHDERSAAFFALGIAKTTGRPVLMVTTSGTAATELHPAIAEADASQTPLIALTADRPTELFDIGASQTIDQRHLFGSAVRWAHDLDVPDPMDSGADHTASLAGRVVSESMGISPGPVHLNIRFREPLVIGDHSTDDLRTSQATQPSVAPDPEALSRLTTQMDARRGIIVVGPQTDRSNCRAVAEMGVALGWPILSDPISGLRSGTHPTAAVVGSDLLASADWLEAATPDFVVRIGAQPTSKALATWLARHSDIPQTIITPSGWPDPMASAGLILRSSVTAAVGPLSSAEPAPTEWLDRWKAADAAASDAARAAIDTIAGPSEPGIAAAVHDGLPGGSMLWAASSMPIRDVDSFFPVSDRPVTIHANRGVNGIDGFISTALGAASGGTPTTALSGDLSMLHDIGALATAARLAIPLTIIVVNNDGGGIFHFLPEAGHEHFERHFGTPHGLSLSRIATSFGIDAETVDDTTAVAEILAKPTDRPRLVEVMTDREANVEIHREIAQAVRDALATL
ncbi:MAG: 2-succinyl-5-enolpyruvyl-6-hydroxy-3-cyclohexene-1-carboxylic-acid synthase [Acidimicrobiia bacterium]